MTTDPTAGDSPRVQRAVVLGAAGEVGGGVVEALLHAQVAVVAVGRSSTRMAALADRLGRPAALATEVGPLDDDADWARLAERVAQRGEPVDAVVASLGGWWAGPATVDLDPAAFDEVLDSSLGAHLRAARAFLPVLADRPAASYVMINGAGGEHPVPGSGPVSISAAAQLMLTRVLAAEHTGPVRIRALVVATPVLSRSRPTGAAGWVGALDVGTAVLELLDGGGAGAVVHRLVAPGRTVAAS